MTQPTTEGAIRYDDGSVLLPMFTRSECEYAPPATEPSKEDAA